MGNNHCSPNFAIFTNLKIPKNENKIVSPLLFICVDDYFVGNGKYLPGTGSDYK
jgi:hypothetical protein